ncbi:MAG TPA: RNase adapter RapZ [Rhodobacteraceae bacterium]|nr:RNase adapter RapZ [Paracoccaceae bacterium]
MTDEPVTEAAPGAAVRANANGASQHVVLVSGASGAGRTTAIRALEDFGYEVIDNLPLRLIPRLLSGGRLDHPLALGIDVRTQGFSAQAMVETVDALVADPDVDVEFLFLDCRAEVLAQRYSETRRRHPLSPDESPIRGIEREIGLLIPVRARADVLVDTSDLTVHELKAEIQRWLGIGSRDALQVTVQSFSYKRGMPRGLDLAFDVRFLRNPHWVPELRPLTGRDPTVAAHVAGDPRYAEFYERVTGLVSFLMPAYAEEGKSHLSIGFGCTGGRHRSVALAESLSKTLAAAGWQVSTRHREVDSALAQGATIKGETGGRPG